MKKTLINILKFAIYFAIGGFLMWFVYRSYDMQEIKDALSGGIKVWWLVIALFAGLLSHISRTIRWQMIIEPIAKRTDTTNTFIAVMIGYFANLLIPRMGEISRCGVLARYEKISMSKLVGTVVVERLIDVISLLVCLVLVLALQFNIVTDFLSRNTDLSGFANIFASIWTYVILLTIVLLFRVFRKWFAQTSPYQKLKGLWSKFAEGFMAIKNIKNKGRFIAHSVFIWVMYFFMIYLNFYAFDFTSHLTPLAGLSVFVLGSLGMVAPVQGGMGPWHFMVIASLQMYGVAKVEGGAFALIVWSSLNAMIVILGIVSLIVLPIINRKRENASA
ncbi:lysylphosphatidylglycerol synthase transmembrane domain-containing protein [Saccharicrinis aurantiacus]|uniref:lysylphosphatidylglycerol synthase transmembrane domain-containing protein n=1 Tax=Saccharicrinis aurantiacus TaxID=1849719 RepID=UPI00094FAF3B|nr:lysylphosphatidylglycerol synthase transmembrane domain-containing protein [Saccharicrinis aurantiacus]